MVVEEVIMIEESIVNLISGGMNPIILPPKVQFLRNRSIWVPIKKIYDRLPYNVQTKIKKWVE